MKLQSKSKVNNTCTTSAFKYFYEIFHVLCFKHEEHCNLYESTIYNVLISVQVFVYSENQILNICVCIHPIHVSLDIYTHMHIYIHIYNHIPP